MAAQSILGPVRGALASSLDSASTKSSIVTGKVGIQTAATLVTYLALLDRMDNSGKDGLLRTTSPFCYIVCK